MATKNRRVAAYLPPEIDKAFTAFKIERGLASKENPNQNDSQALIQLLSEFLAVSPQSGYSVSHVGGLVTLEQMETLKAELEARISELFGELSGELSDVKSKMKALKSSDHEVDRKNEVFSVAPGQLPLLCEDETSKPLGLTALSSRLGKSSGTLSKYKDDPEKLATWTQSHDPDGMAWRYEPNGKRFYPVEESSK